MRGPRGMRIACCALILSLMAPEAASADELRDAIQEHVDHGIQRSKRRKKRRSTSRPAKKPSSAKPERATPTPVENPVEAKDNGPGYPRRVFGSDFRLDITVGGAYRGWAPQPYDAVDVEVANYYTWNIEVRAKIFRFLNLHRGYYESNALAGPRTDSAAVAAQVGSYVPKAAWLLGMIGIPILKVWEPIIRYETRAFETRAKPRRAAGVTLVDYSSGEESQEQGTLKMVSAFETLVLGVRYNQSKDPSAVIETPADKLPPMFFGLGLMSYRKPYQVTVDGLTLDEYLFDGRFRGAGLAFGTTVGGGVEQLVLDVDVQAGVGQVKLSSKLDLYQFLPSDYLVTYLQGTARFGYRYPLWDFAPTLMIEPMVNLGGAAFFLLDTRTEDGEAASTPVVNWDLLWRAQLSLVLSL